MTDCATLKKIDDISIISLDDGKVNVFSIEMLEAINNCLNEVPKDSGSLVLRGKEGIFSAGFDLKTFASGDMDKISKMSDLGMRFMYDIFTFPRPVIAALTGHTIAMGLFVACGCDYRIGLKGDFVAQANEVRNDMDIPTSIMQIAASRVSKKHAYSVLLHADPYTFPKAIEAGLIDQLVDEANFESRIMEKAADLATLGHPHYEKTKNAYIADDVRIIKPLIVK